MILFLDASALVKLYHEERGTRIMRTLFVDPEYVDAIFASDLVMLEVLARLTKHTRLGGRKVQRDFRRKLKMYAYDREQHLSMISTDKGVIQDAERIAVQYRDSGAGTLDLLHVAAARHLQRMLPEQPLVFVVADRKLRSLVERIGFRTLDPEARDPRS